MATEGAVSSVWIPFLAFKLPQTHSSCISWCCASSQDICFYGFPILPSGSIKTQEGPWTVLSTTVNLSSLQVWGTQQVVMGQQQGGCFVRERELDTLLVLRGSSLPSADLLSKKKPSFYYCTSFLSCCFHHCHFLSFGVKGNLSTGALPPRSPSFLSLNSRLIRDLPLYWGPRGMFSQDRRMCMCDKFWL